MGTISDLCQTARSARTFQTTDEYTAGVAAGIDMFASYLASGGTDADELLQRIVPSIEVDD